MLDIQETNPVPVSELYASTTSLLDNISSIVLGKRDVARLCLVALLAGEHILLEDVPGVGKTLMGKALARSVDGSFTRIQFTPDLLPSDIVGSSVFDSSENKFVFNRGPVFSNFVLSDEINRAPPRTQSALLEAMSDSQVSVDGTTYTLEQPFMVIATQNPFEFEGTYVLPESQLDRFLMRISMGYPDREYEADILNNHRDGQPVDRLQSVCDSQRIVAIQNAVRQIKVDPAIAKYMLDVVEETRTSADLALGVSTRGALLWYRAVQALAMIESRDYVVPDDPKSLAVAVLSHRCRTVGVLHGSGRAESESAIADILSRVPMPG